MAGRSDVREAQAAMTDPTACDYAPPGEYVKDHTLALHDGWWHLYSISGTRGYCHGYNGNERPAAARGV